MLLYKGITEGWVNQSYAVMMNKNYPDINAQSPGKPYFTDAEKADIGQWIRIVFQRTGKTEQKFWCVAIVAEVIDEDTVRFADLGYENGSAPPPKFKDYQWQGFIKRAEDKTWDVSALEPMAPEEKIDPPGFVIIRKKKSKKST